MADKLTRLDWMQAGFRALTQGGPQAIRAEALARELGLSKGSFYWHFKDVADLKTSMIRHWQDAATEAIIQALEQQQAPAKQRLQDLMRLASSDANAPYGGHQTEQAIRDWARYDRAVKTIVHGVDQRRVSYVETLFHALGQPRQNAAKNARILYAGLVGLQQLENLDGCDFHSDLKDLLNALCTTP